MSTQPVPQVVTAEEYLAFDRASEERYEFVDGQIRTMDGQIVTLGGQIRAMSGASRAHGRIVMNLGASLHTQLRGGPCEVLSQAMRTAVMRAGAYVYPDIVVACGAALEDEQQHTLLDPTVVIEVLSPSTEAYDRGRKGELYRRIPSLQDYLLVAQDAPHIERYTRHGEGLWLFSEMMDLDAVLDIASIGCELRLREVYDRVLDAEAPGGAARD